MARPGRRPRRQTSGALRDLADEGPIRAWMWVKTVITPLLRALPIEADYARRELWTWSAHLGRCELLRSTREMIGEHRAPNLDDLIRCRVELAPLFAAHDDAVVTLERGLTKAQRVLEQDAAFREVVERVTMSHLARHPDDAPWAPFKRSHLTPLAAQFVLDGVDPEDSKECVTSLHPLWADHHAELSPFGIEPRMTLRPAGRAVLEANRLLAKALEEVRRRLCDAHEIPPFLEE